MSAFSGDSNSGGKRLTRRGMIRALGLGAGVVAVAPLLQACAGQPAAAPTTAPATQPPAQATKPAAQATQPAAQATQPAAKPAASSGQKVKLIWTGWNVVDQFAPHVEKFKEENPTIDVEYVALPDYKKQTTMLAAGEQDDVINTRDDDLAGYVDAGFIQPIDMAYPGIKEVDQDTYPGNLEAMSYKGKRYGLAYYTDFHSLMYNDTLLKKGGFEKPPANLDELKSQAVTLKQKGVAEYPIRLWLQQEANFKEPIYAFMYASGGRFLDDNLNGLTDNPIMVSLLEWFVDGFQNTKILDLSNLTMTDEDSVDLFMNGKSVYHGTNRYDLRKLNDPKQSKIAVEGQRVAQMMIMPGLKEPQGTVSWTRSITVNAKTKYPDEARKLQFFAGAKNKDGIYWSAKNLHARFGLGFVYKSLATDPDIVKGEQTWGDPALFAKQKETARPREGTQLAWYSEWDNAMTAEWHKAFLKQITPKEAVANIAKKWNDLKKQYGG